MGRFRLSGFDFFYTLLEQSVEASKVYVFFIYMVV